jgi:dihydroneopterin aldolase
MLIQIKNLKVKTVIGVYEWEEKIQRELIFNIEIKLKSEKSLSSDKLEDSVDYDEIIAIVKKISKKRFALIEKMGGEIIKEILQDKRIKSCKISIDKTAIYKDVESCCVVIEKKNN